LAFHIAQSDVGWTKRSALVALNHPSPPRSEKQLLGGAFLLRRTPHTEQLVERWYRLALDQPHLFTDEDNFSGFADFHTHRHDQSLWSILRHLGGTHHLVDETDRNVCHHGPFVTVRRKMPDV